MPAITPERMTINQKTQFGLETTAGTDVAATKVFEAIDVTMGIQLSINKKRAMGRKFPRLATIGNEMVGWKYSGKPTFDEMTYLWAGLWGNVTPTGQGVLGKNYKFVPVITGPQSPQPFSFQQGDTVRAHKVNFAVETDHTLHISNTDNDISGSGISHPLQDSAVLTSNPTVVAAQAISKPMWAFFNDATAIALGNTQAVTPLDIEFSYGGAYGPLYAINRDGKYKNVVDLEPQTHFAVLFEADSEGMGYLPGIRLGSKQYQRLNAIGPMIENSWTVDLGGAGGGTFTIGFNGSNIAAQSPSVTGSSLQTLFLALGTVGGGNATITGPAGGPYIVTFTGTLATTALPLQFNGTSLTGQTRAPSNTPTAYIAQIDACTVCTAIKEFSDSSGVFAVGYTFEFFEDPAWTAGSANGTAAVATMINTLASL